MEAVIFLLDVIHVAGVNDFINERLKIKKEYILDFIIITMMKNIMIN